VNLAERLRAVVRSQGAGAASPVAAADPRLSALLDAAPATESVRFNALEQVLGGHWREAAHGRSFVVVRRFNPGVLHGSAAVGDIANCLSGATTSAPLVSVPAARAPFIFFDLETTGLSGGAGTYAFMVGCGWFDEGGGFVTEQHLLADYGSERVMLQSVAGELGRAGALVSFNGKSFDAPVLETRYAYNRMDSPCADRPHLDVLHPARRFWENGESCSLIALERQVLGSSRTGDVPGFEIPARYFQFIRSGDPRPLAAIFEHNRLDLLSLAALTARLLHLVDGGPSRTRDAREAVALGRIYWRAGLERRAVESFEHGLALCEAACARASRPFPNTAARRPSASDVSVRVEALRSLAVRARRARQFDAAAERWQQLLEVPGCPRPILREASEALAIHHEHRARDLATAKVFALRTLEMRSEAGSKGTSSERCGDAVRHRLARIERKMVSERSLFPSSPSQPLLSCGSQTSGPRTSS
jgi:uncharacterized protein